MSKHTIVSVHGASCDICGSAIKLGEVSHVGNVPLALYRPLTWPGGRRALVLPTDHEVRVYSTKAV